MHTNTPPSVSATILLSLIAAAAVTPAAAQLPATGPTADDINGPRGGMPHDVWSSAFSSPNATAGASVRGFNMTLPYPGSPSANWTYSIDVRDDVPLPGTTDTFATGTWVRLFAPQELVQPSRNNASILIIPQDSSWSNCRLAFFGPDLRSDTPIPDASCRGYLSDECIRDFRTWLSEGFKNSERTGPGGESECPLPTPRGLPGSCYFDSGVVGWGGGESLNRLSYALVAGIRCIS